MDWRERPVMHLEDAHTFLGAGSIFRRSGTALRAIHSFETRVKCRLGLRASGSGFSDLQYRVLMRYQTSNGVDLFFEKAWEAGFGDHAKHGTIDDLQVVEGHWMTVRGFRFLNLGPGPVKVGPKLRHVYGGGARALGVDKLIRSKWLYPPNDGENHNW